MFIPSWYIVYFVNCVGTSKAFKQNVIILGFIFSIFHYVILWWQKPAKNYQDVIFNF